MLEWMVSKLAGTSPSVFLLPILLFVIVRLFAMKEKRVGKWWVLLILLPGSILVVDLFFYLPFRLMKGIPFHIEQFNETAIWAIGLGLVQYGVFYVYHWLWILLMKALNHQGEGSHEL
jgi:hypothetical protein